MPALRTYRVFISHCWEYSADYYRLVEWLNSEALFRWKDLSLPADRAIRQDKWFESRLRKRLSNSDILLVIVGMEIAYRYWIKWEIKWARIRGIPIVGVMPNGRQQIPRIVQAARSPIVGWRRDSIIGAIRQFAPKQR